MGFDGYFILRKGALRITQVLGFVAIVGCRAVGYLRA